MQEIRVGWNGYHLAIGSPLIVTLLFVFKLQGIPLQVPINNSNVASSHTCGRDLAVLKIIVILSGSISQSNYGLNLQSQFKIVTQSSLRSSVGAAKVCYPGLGN